MAFKFNIFTGNLDVVNDPPDQYIDGEVEFHADLPIGATPPVNSAYLVRKGSGVYFVNRKPAGIWVRELTNGNLDDWKYAGTFSDLYRDANFRIIHDLDTSRQIAFDVSGVSSGATRTLKSPNKSGVIALESEVRSDFVSPFTYTGQAAAGASESSAVWFIRRSEFSSAGAHVSTTTANNVEWDDRLTATYT